MKPTLTFLAVLLLAPLAATAQSKQEKPEPTSPIALKDGVVPPCRPVAEAIEKAMVFFKKTDDGYVPGRLDGTLAPYFTDAFMGIKDGRSTRGIAYPARLHGQFIRTFLRCYTYTGDASWMLRARDLADWNIARSSPPDAEWPHLAYSTFEKGKPAGHKDKNALQPDKAAFIANSYLMLHEATGETRYLDAARKVAETLLKKQAPDGSWPFRVVPETGEITQKIGGAPVFFVEFFERLLQHENKDAYRQARDKALAYMMDRNIAKGLWGTYHEDVGLKQGTHLSAELMCYTAEYLIRSSAAHPEHLPMARRVLKQMEDKLVFTEEHGAAPAPGAAEQSGFEHIMAGHTARYGACLAQLYRATGDDEVKRRALSTLHGVTHMQTDEGVFVTFFYHMKKDKAGPKVVDRVWFSQHLFSIYNLLGGMATFPQLAPDGQDHILGSSLPLRDVAYAPGSVHYTASAPAEVKVKLGFVPEVVTLDGKPLHKLDKLPQDGKLGWFFDPATGMLILNHATGRASVAK
jgi:hypothetical protein